MTLTLDLNAPRDRSLYPAFGFDYGWSPAGGLGSTHKLSLSYRF